MSYIGICETEDLLKSIKDNLRKGQYNRIVFSLGILLDPANSFESDATGEIYSFIADFYGYISQTKDYVGHLDELIEIFERFCNSENYYFRYYQAELYMVIAAMYKNFKNDSKFKAYCDKALERIDQLIMARRTYPGNYCRKIEVLSMMAERRDEIPSLLEQLKMVCEIDGDYFYYRAARRYKEAEYDLSPHMPF